MSYRPSQDHCVDRSKVHVSSSLDPYEFVGEWKRLASKKNITRMITYK